MEYESSVYDDRTQCKEINILKTILPFLQTGTQKNISMMIAFLQMQKTMEYFEDPENTMALCAMEQKDNTTDLLLAVKKHCSPKEQQQIDQILQALQMMETYEMMMQGGTELL
jgi:hypothetical protein